MTEIKRKDSWLWLFFGQSQHPRERYLLMAALLVIAQQTVHDEPRKLKDLIDEA